MEAFDFFYMNFQPLRELACVHLQISGCFHQPVITPSAIHDAHINPES